MRCGCARPLDVAARFGGAQIVAYLTPRCESCVMAASDPSSTGFTIRCPDRRSGPGTGTAMSRVLVDRSIGINGMRTGSRSHKKRHGFRSRGRRLREALPPGALRPQGRDGIYGPSMQAISGGRRPSARLVCAAASTYP